MSPARSLRRLAIFLLTFCAAGLADSQVPRADTIGEAASTTSPIPLESGLPNPLDIPVPEARLRSRDDAGNRVLDPGASTRNLDALREDRLESSTQRYRPALPSRRDDRSVDARANRRLDELRYPRRDSSRPGRLGF